VRPLLASRERAKVLDQRPQSWGNLRERVIRLKASERPLHGPGIEGGDHGETIPPETKKARIPEQRRRVPVRGLLQVPCPRAVEPVHLFARAGFLDTPCGALGRQSSDVMWGLSTQYL